MTAPIRHWILAAAMGMAAALAFAAKPTIKVSDEGTKVNLELMIPRQFGDWRELPMGGAQIVDPVQRATLDKIYNQTLSRAYVNHKGYVVMLSIAYGSDQREGLEMHLPDVCYPAQGFQFGSREIGTMSLPTGVIPATRLTMSLGARKEPITYWTVIGDRVTRGNIDKKLVEMRYALLNHRIVDGVLMRISSIDPDSARAYALHDQFAEALIGAVATSDRARFGGAPQGG